MEPPGVVEEALPVLKPEELERLMKAAAGKSFEQRRDTALLRLLADSGMRRGRWLGSSPVRPLPASVGAVAGVRRVARNSAWQCR